MVLNGVAVHKVVHRVDEENYNVVHMGVAVRA